MNRISFLFVAALGLGVGEARAQSAPQPLNPDVQAVAAEAKYENGVLLDRVLTCVVQITRDSQEVARLTSELAVAKSEIEKLKPKPETPAPAPAPDKPPETPK